MAGYYMKCARLLLALGIVFNAPFIVGQEIVEGGDYIFIGFELEKLLGLVNGVIALFLFFVAYLAYRRDERKRLLYVSLAFLIFSVKGFMLASQNFFDIDFVDPMLPVLEFFVLLFFFFGVLKKER